MSQHEIGMKEPNFYPPKSPKSPKVPGTQQRPQSQLPLLGNIMPAVQSRLARSNRIANDVWEGHKAEIKSLYSKLPLAEVIDIMDRKYRFRPSNRQYGYRLKQIWGLAKYNNGNNKDRALSFGQSDAFNDDSDYGVQHPRTAIYDLAFNLNVDEHLPTSVQSLSNLVGKWTDGETNTKLSAELYFSVSDDERAFELLSQLYSAKRDDPDVSQGVKHRLLIDCARAANCTKTGRIAKRHIQDYKAQFKLDSHLELDLRLLDAYVDERSELVDANTTFQRVYDIMETCAERVACSITMRQTRYTTIDLVTFCLIVYGWNRCQAHGQANTLNPEDILCNYVSHQPLFSMLRREEQTPLLACIDWCTTYLSGEIEMPSYIDEIPDMQIDSSWVDTVKVFCTLWEYVFQSNQQDTAPPWYTECESRFGISPSEFLFGVCWLFNIDDDPPEAAVYSSVIQRATTKADLLSRQSETSLWLAFLKVFAQMNTPDRSEEKQPCPGGMAIEDVVAIYVQRFLSGLLPQGAGSLPASSADFYGGFDAMEDPTRIDTSMFDGDLNELFDEFIDVLGTGPV